MCRRSTGLVVFHGRSYSSSSPLPRAAVTRPSVGGGKVHVMGRDDGGKTLLRTGAAAAVSALAGAKASQTRITVIQAPTGGQYDQIFDACCIYASDNDSHRGRPKP